MRIRSGHLCSGYDGLGMALRLAGVEHVPNWHVENEPDAAHVLRLSDPEPQFHRNLGDLTDPTLPEYLARDRVDIVTAGVPCQPVSVQGRKRGKSDKRWLWPYARTAIRAAEPFRVFLENVGNLVTIEGGKLHAEILSDLREDGFAVRWGIYGACEVGAAHHRHRWFLLADRVANRPAPEAVHVRRMTCGYPLKLGRLLPTPRAGDEKRGVEPDRAARTGTGPTLNDAVGTLAPGTWGIYDGAIRRHEATMGAPAPMPLDEHGRLSGQFAEWLMMLPAGHISGRGLQRQDVVRLAGNGVVPDQARFAYQRLGG